MSTSTSLLTPKQASDYLSLSVYTLRNWRYQGQGPRHIKAGRAVRYRLSDLDDWLAAGTR